MATRSYAFHHVDVFTQTLFEGNPLAVFTDARGLDDSTMQRIARELNLSETAFVFPATTQQAIAALRIFTPASEIPFAGHPTVGSAFVLHAGGTIPPGCDEFILEERVGPVPVRLEHRDGFMAWLTTPPIAFGPLLDDRAAVAGALGLHEDELLAAPPRIAGAGAPFAYVALANEASVDRASLDARAMRAVLGDRRTSGVYVFALRDGGVYSRMFAPDFGIVEDPATGSATGPLTAYLLEHGLVAERDGLRLTCEQGTLMGRRSILHVLVSGTGTRRRIEVGGSAVYAFEATFPLQARG